MLKGLEWVKTHQHREWLPIIENWQAMPPPLAKIVTGSKKISATTRADNDFFILSLLPDYSAVTRG